VIQSAAQLTQARTDSNPIERPFKTGFEVEDCNCLQVGQLEAGKSSPNKTSFLPKIT